MHEVFLFLGGPKKTNIFHPQKISGLYLYYLRLFFGFKSSPSPVGAAAMSYGSPSSRVAEGSPAGQRRAGRVAEGSPSARHLSLGQLHGELARLEELAQELRGEIAARWRLETKGDLVSMFLVGLPELRFLICIRVYIYIYINIASIYFTIKHIDVVSKYCICLGFSKRRGTVCCFSLPPTFPLNRS